MKNRNIFSSIFSLLINIQIYIHFQHGIDNSISYNLLNFFRNSISLFLEQWVPF